MRALFRFGRLLSLIVAAVLGTSALMYCAPGYFSDSREMDAVHAAGVRDELDHLRQNQTSLPKLLGSQMRLWCHGDLGQSRQYDAPVASLLRNPAARSGRLLLTGVLTGWAVAILFALPLSLIRTPHVELAVGAGTAVLLALPVSALATVCLLANIGGPAMVLASVIAVRDFKVLHRLLQTAWKAPHLLHGRAQGLSALQLFSVHLFPVLRREVLSLAVMSFTLALSALVPVEVVFDINGLGHLAWTAAMNRDLPVLTAVTALVALGVGLAGLFVEPERAVESAQCA